MVGIEVDKIALRFAEHVFVDVELQFLCRIFANEGEVGVAVDVEIGVVRILLKKSAICRSVNNQRLVPAETKRRLEGHAYLIGNCLDIRIYEKSCLIGQS